MFRFVAFVSCCFCFIEARFYKGNITDFSKCQIYYSRSGSVYKDFFEISEEPQNGSLLDFHFSVMSPSDAHILLAPSNKLEKGDPVYEIVIGAGGNTFCDIRRKVKSEVKATVRIKDLLSALDQHSFWIHISKDGVIGVGKEGEELAFLTWTDPDPLPLKVFSFSTWHGIEAKWYYNCPHNDTAFQHSKELEKPMTSLEKIRRDLLSHYNPYVRPVYNLSTTTVVKMILQHISVDLDVHKAVLQFRSDITLSWQDEKLLWNASNYGGIKDLHIFRREIWVPDVASSDAVMDGSEVLQDTFLIVNSSGYVNWITTMNMNTWCSPADLGRWPRDEHSCQITLMLFKDYDKIKLQYEVKNITNTGTSLWALYQVETYSYVVDSPMSTINLKMRRVSNTYTILLFTPFIVIAVSLLMVFWMSPFSQLKLSTACLQLILISTVLLALGVIIPIHFQLVPNIVLLYSYGLVAAVICIVIETVVINLSRNEQTSKLPYAATKLLLSVFLKMFLCLPDVQTSKQFGNLDKSFSNEHNQAMWILLGVVIDRVAFFVYLGLVVYALCLTY